MDEILVTIRPATQADLLPLQQLSITTFTDTYAVYNTPENMQLYIDTYYNDERLLSELADANMQYLVAFVGEELAGYVKLRTIDNPPELAGTKHIEIERIYVLPGFKGMKIGKKLVDHSIETARQQQFNVIWLGVWEKNPRAIRFYEKNGFELIEPEALPASFPRMVVDKRFYRLDTGVSA